MQIGNITSKVEGLFYNNAQLIGIAGGTFGIGGGFEAVLNNLRHIAEGHIGMPDIGSTIQEFIDPSNITGQMNFQAAQWWIGGWLLKELGFGGRLGGAIQDIAKGFVIGNGIRYLIGKVAYA